MTQLSPVAALPNLVGGVLGKLVVEEKVLLLHTTYTRRRHSIVNHQNRSLCHLSLKQQVFRVRHLTRIFLSKKDIPVVLLKVQVTNNMKDKIRPVHSSEQLSLS